MHGTDPRSDDQLVQAFRDGDGGGFAILFERHLDRVVRYAAFLAFDREEARDIAQEVFLKAHHGLPEYRLQGTFTAWLLTITRRTVIDRKRRQHPLPQVDPLQPPPPGTEDLAIARVDTSSPLNLLSAAEREAVVLRVQEGLPYAEIARITGSTEGALRKMVCMSLKRLAKEMTEHDLSASARME